MSSFVSGSVLLLGLLVPVVIRIFIKKRTSVDTAVILVPVSICVFAIHVCAFGVQLFTVLLAALILYVFITNFRALLRYINGLYVDFYRVPYLISTVISGIAIVVLTFILFWFAPLDDMNIIITVHDRPPYSETRTVYTGTAYQGLTEKQNLLERSAAVARTYTPASVDAEKPVIMFVPDVCVSSADYVPVMKELAVRGYICTAADITTVDTSLSALNGTWIRPFVMRVRRAHHPETYSQILAESNQKKLLETEAYLKVLKKQYPGREIIIAADEMYDLLSSENLDGVKVLHLSLDGLGFLPLTQPLDASCLLPEKYPFSGRRASDRIVYQTADFIIGESR